MSDFNQNINFKLTTDSQAFIQGFVAAGGSVEQLQDKISKLTAVEQQIAKAEQELAFVRANGTKEAIAGVEQELQAFLKVKQEILSGIQQETAAREKANAEIGGFTNALSSALPILGQLKSATVALFSAYEGLGHLVEEVGEAKRQIDVLTETTGLARSTAVGLTIANKQIGGSYLQAVAAADKFSETLVKARSGDEGAIERLNRLGIGQKDLTKSSDELFITAVKTFAGLKAGAETAALGYESFGLRAQKGVFTFGKQVDELKRQAEESGAALDALAGAKLDKFNRAFTNFSVNLEGLKNIVGADIAPLFTELALRATDAIGALRLNPDIQVGFKQLSGFIQNVGKELGGLAIDTISSLAISAGKVGEYLGAADNFLADISANLKQISPFTSDLVGDLSLVSLATATIRNDVKVLTTAIELLTSFYKGLADLSPFGKTKKEATEATAATKEVTKATQEYGEVLKGIESQAAKVGKADKESISLLKETIAERKQALKDEDLSKVESAQKELELVRSTSAQVVALYQKQYDDISRLRNLAAKQGQDTTKLDEDQQKAALELRKANLESQKEISNATRELQKASLDKQLQDLQSKLTQEKTLGEQQLATIETNLQNQVVSHQKAAQQISEVKQKPLKDEIAGLEQILASDTLTTQQRISLAQQLATAQLNLAKQEASDEKAINAGKLADQKALYDSQRSALKTKLSQDKSDQEAAFAEIDKLVEAGTINREQAAERRSIAALKPLTDEIAGLNELLASDTLTTKQREDLAKELAGVKAQLSKQERENDKAINAGKIADAKAAIETIKAQQASASKEEQAAIELVVQKFKDGEITKQQAIQQTAQIELAATNKNLARQQETLQKLQQEQKEGANVGQDIETTQENISELTRERVDLEKVLNGSISQNSKTYEGIESKFKETNQEAKRAIDQQGEAYKVVSEGLKELKSNADKYADSAQSYLSNVQKQADFFSSVVNDLGAGFRVTNDNLDQSVAKVSEFKKKLEDIKLELLQKGAFDIPLQIAGDTLEAQIERIEKEISAKRQEIEDAANEKSRQARIKAETEANVQILNDLKKEIAEEDAAEEAHKKDKQKRLQEISDTKDQIAKDEKQKATDNAAALDAIDEEYAQKEKDRAEQLGEAKFKSAQEANNRISELNKQSRLSELDAEDQFASSQADIRKEIAAKQKELASSTDPNQKKQLETDIKSLQDKLKGGADQEEARKKATEKRDKQIADAKLQLDKDLGAATNDAQREAAQKRFDTATQAANDELKVELDYQKAKAKAIADGDAEELKTIEANHIKKLAAIKQAADEQNAITSQTLAHAEEVIAAQAAAEKAAYEKKRADQKQRGDQELADLKTADKAKLDQQIADLAASNQAFKDAEEARKAALAEQIASITGNLGLASGQIQDYIGKLAASLGIAADKIKPIADAIAKITADTKTTNDAASSQANADNGGSPSNSNSILGSPSSTPSGNNPSSGNTPGNTVNPTANITKKPPSNADSNPNQGAGAGTSKTGGQQPGSTGLPSPGTTSPGSVEALVAALTKLYQDFKGVPTTDKVNAISKTVIDLITATAQNLKLKIVNGSLVLNDGTSASIAGSMAARISPAIYNQRKGLFNKGISDLVANFADAVPADTKGDDQEEGTGDGKLAKGGDIGTPGGINKGQGGGALNTGNTTSKTIVTTQPTAKKPDGRDSLRIADNEATKGAGQGIDDVLVGFANNPDSKTGGFGTGANTRGDTTPASPSTPPTSPTQATIKAPVNFAPVLQFNIDPKSFSDTITKAIMQAAQDPSFAKKLMRTFDQSTTLTSR